MKLVVKIKNTHFILFFLSICVFFPISTLNNKILTKSNNLKDLKTSNYQTSEFTNTNDNENNKKYIFMENQNKNKINKKKNIIDQTDSDNPADKSNKNNNFLEGSFENSNKPFENGKSEEKIFDEKNIIDLIENAIRNNEKNSIRPEKSKIIEELKLLNHQANLNSLLKQNMIRNINKEVDLDLLLHSKFFKNKQKEEEEQFSVNNPTPYFEPPQITHNDNPTNNKLSNKSEIDLINEEQIDIIKNYINLNNHYQLNTNQQSLDKDYSISNPTPIDNILQNDEFIKNYDIYSNSNTVNKKSFNDFSNYFIPKIQRKPFFQKSNLSNCPCEKRIKCKPCQVSFDNNLTESPFDNPIRAIDTIDCPCARKNLCPPCPPESLIHDLAYRKAQENIKNFKLIKTINDNLSLKADEMLKFAKQTEEIENQAVTIANKLSEFNTKSFLAKNKMIELNEKARKIALSFYYPKENTMPCDPLRYPCQESLEPFNESQLNIIENSSPYLSNSGINNPNKFNDIPSNDNSYSNNNFLKDNSFYSFNQQQIPSVEPNYNYNKKASSDYISPDNSLAKLAGRHYFFEKERKIKSEVIDKDKDMDNYEEIEENPIKKIDNNKKKLGIIKMNVNNLDEFDKNKPKKNMKISNSKELTQEKIEETSQLSNENNINEDAKQTNKNINNDKQGHQTKKRVSSIKRKDKDSVVKEYQKNKKSEKRKENAIAEIKSSDDTNLNTNENEEEINSKEEMDIIKEESENFTNKNITKKQNSNLKNKSNNADKNFE